MYLAHPWLQPAVFLLLLFYLFLFPYSRVWVNAMIGLYDGRRAMVGDQGGVSIICLMDLMLQRQYYSGSKPDAAGFCACSRTRDTDTVRVSERCWRR